MYNTYYKIYLGINKVNETCWIVTIQNKPMLHNDEF